MGLVYNYLAECTLIWLYRLCSVFQLASYLIGLSYLVVQLHEVAQQLTVGARLHHTITLHMIYFIDT